jgi:hypothetical protein
MSKCWCNGAMTILTSGGGGQKVFFVGIDGENKIVAHHLLFGYMKIIN